METDREKILQIFVAESKDHLREMEESLLTQALNKGEITMSARLDTIDQVQYLSFHIAGEEYAIPVFRVKEIIEYETVTKVPAIPPVIRGVINLRGAVVPVVDLAIKFGLPQTAITKRTCVVIVELEQEGEQIVMGVMVDDASQVLELGPEDLIEPPSFGTKVNVDYLLSLGKSGARFTLILDIDRLLSPDELLEAQSLIEQAGPLDIDQATEETGDDLLAPEADGLMELDCEAAL